MILAELERTGGVRGSELTARFGVSDMSVRRDLKHLECHGWLRKVHGGAVPTTSTTKELGFEAKKLLQRSVNRAIAERATELIEPNMAVGISAGITTWMLASLLQGNTGPLSVVTNSTTVADVLFANGTSAGVTVILTGGVRTPSAALVGAVADRSINSLHVDRFFLEVHGMDPTAGLTTPNLAELQTDRALMEHARQVVVLADSTNWRTVGSADFGPLSVADVVITDDRLPDDARTLLSDQVGELIIVSAHAEPRTSVWAGSADRNESVS